MRITAPIIAITLAIAARATAGDFDAMGRFTMDGAIAVGFEAAETQTATLFWSAFAPLGLEVLDGNWQPVTPDWDFAEELRPEWIRTDPVVALEGESVLVAGGGIADVTLGMRTDELLGRRVEVRLWQRPEGTRVHPVLSGVIGDSLSGGFIHLFPTGRATTDGWTEWTTGPFDWGYGGTNGTHFLSLTDAQIAVGFSGELTGPTSVADAPYLMDVTVLVDAIEIIDLGPAGVPDVACRLPDEAETCGPYGVCVWGHCVDAATMVGRLMTGDFRSQYLARRAFEIASFSGGRRSMARAEEAASALESVDRDDVGSRELWSTLMHVYRDVLADGHSHPPVIRAPGGNLGICLHLGEADLLPGSPGPVPMVFSVADDAPMPAELQPGDALTEIDGLPPEDWIELAPLYFSESGEPRSRLNANAPRIIPAALRSGAELVFARCQPQDGSTPCAAADVEEIRVDLGAGLAGIWGDTVAPPAFLFAFGAVCDYRLGRVTDDDPTDFATWSWADVDGVRMVESNGHFVSPVSQVEDALGDPFERILFDHRWGNGGVRQTESYIASFLMAEDDVEAYEVYPPFTGELTQERRDRFLACLSRGDSGCGGAARVEAADAGGHWVNGESRLAIVNAFDVSSSDFISMRLTLRQAGETRIFGVGSTHGAFGTYLPPPTYGAEGRPPWIGREDLVFVVDGEPTEFLNGAGVAPDEVVLQLQSDALQGIDTVLEAAEAWVRQ